MCKSQCESELEYRNISGTRGCGQTCMVALDIGDYCTANVYADADQEFVVATDGSGFSMSLLDTGDRPLAAAYSRSGNNQHINQSNTNQEIDRYASSGYPTLLASPHMDSTTGRFTAAEAGVYLVSATIRVDRADVGYFVSSQTLCQRVHLNSTICLPLPFIQLPRALRLADRPGCNQRRRQHIQRPECDRGQHGRELRVRVAGGRPQPGRARLPLRVLQCTRRRSALAQYY